MNFIETEVKKKKKKIGKEKKKKKKKKKKFFFFFRLVGGTWHLLHSHVCIKFCDSFEIFIFTTCSSL